MAKRPSIKEILEAARHDGQSPAAAAAPVETAAAAAVVRVLPPIDEITDPRDVAEALRRVGARKAAEAAAVAKGFHSND